MKKFLMALGLLLVGGLAEAQYGSGYTRPPTSGAPTGWTLSSTNFDADPILDPVVGNPFLVATCPTALAGSCLGTDNFNSWTIYPATSGQEFKYHDTTWDSYFRLGANQAQIVLDAPALGQYTSILGSTTDWTTTVNNYNNSTFGRVQITPSKVEVTTSRALGATTNITATPTSTTFSEAFVKRLGGANYRIDLQVNDYALGDAINESYENGYYVYTYITDATPSIVGGDISVCGYTSLAAKNLPRPVVECGTASCVGALAGNSTNLDLYQITSIETNCSVLGGGGDELLTVTLSGNPATISNEPMVPSVAFSGALNPGNTNLALLACNDTGGCTVTDVAEPSATDDYGRELKIVNVGTTNIVIDDVDEGQELAGDANLTLGPGDSLTLLWIVRPDANAYWVQVAASNN